MKQPKTSNEDPLHELAKLRALLEKHEKITKKREEEEIALRQRYRQLLKQYAELKKAQQQVIQRERLHALGQMASGIVPWGWVREPIPTRFVNQARPQSVWSSGRTS